MKQEQETWTETLASSSLAQRIAAGPATATTWKKEIECDEVKSEEEVEVRGM
jgi:hypothetical protein